MVTNSTIELINTVSDINIEYNIKLYIMVAMWLYFAFIFWFSFKFDGDRLFIKAWRIISRFISLPYLVFSPMFTFFLLRTVEFETLYIYMISFYGTFLVVWFVLFILALWEFGSYLLGFNITPERMVNEMSAKTPFSDPFIERKR